MKLTGLIAAPHTPFHDDGSLNLSAVEKQAEHFQRTGVSGAFVGGSTGEATSLTVAERCDLVQRWCQVAQGTDRRLRVRLSADHERLDFLRVLRVLPSDPLRDPGGLVLPGTAAQLENEEAVDG